MTVAQLTTSASKTSNAKRAVERRARRWLDVLDLYSTNGLPRDRWPGQHLVTPSESCVIRKEALARLERLHPELSAAVQDLLAEEVAAEKGLSYEEWKRQGHRWFARISRIRRMIRRQCLQTASGAGVY